MAGKVQPILEILKKAQEYDLRLFEAQKYFSDLPHEREILTASLEREKAQLREFEESLKKLQLLRKEKEGTLEQKEYNVKKLDGQLSQVKTNKEYAAIQQEIASLKADNSILEEEVIKILDDIEEAAAAVQKEKGRLQEAEKEHQKKKEDLAQKEKKYRDEIDGLRKEREDILKGLAPDVRDLYERIVKKNNGRALTSTKGGVCGACQIKLRAQVINEVMIGDSLVMCDCNSYILYTEE
ncbi:MAG: zinc ribbon domain-containing protein [Candidatus Omnitrophota bacterium]